MCHQSEHRISYVCTFYHLTVSRGLCLLSHLHAYSLGSAVCFQSWDSRIFQALLLFLLDLLIRETKDWGGEKKGICLPFFLPSAPVVIPYSWF